MCINVVAHRGQSCLTGRTTTNGPQGTWLPHGEDNSPKGCLTGRFFYFTLTGYLTLIAPACPGADPSRLVLPPLLKGLECWCPGGGPVVPLPSRPSWFAEGRTWTGRLAVPLMPWHGGFSSLGVSSASDHKATQEELDINHSGVSLCVVLAIYLV